MENRIKGYRLSPQQERIWSLMEDGSDCLATCSVCVEGPVKPALLYDALHSLTSSHQILRTTFHRPPGFSAPIQIISDPPLIDWQTFDLSDLPVVHQHSALADLSRQHLRPGFDLRHGPTLRATLISTSLTRHTLLVSLPSLCCDRPGLSYLVADLARAYASAAGGHEPSAEPVQYVQFSEWQNQLLEDEEAQAGRDYWANLGLADRLDLRLYCEAKAAQSQHTQAHILERGIEAELAVKLKQVCLEQGLEAKAMMLACWAILLGRLTDSAQLVVATQADARKYDELESAIRGLQQVGARPM